MSSRNRWTMWMAFVGATLAAIPVLLIRWHPTGYDGWLLKFSRFPMVLADWVTLTIFTQERIGPTAAEALLFDTILILGSAIQWGLIGCLIGWLIQYRATKRGGCPKRTT